MTAVQVAWGGGTAGGVNVGVGAEVVSVEGGVDFPFAGTQCVVRGSKPDLPGAKGLKYYCSKSYWKLQ